jgi:hypothetical protein
VPQAQHRVRRRDGSRVMGGQHDGAAPFGAGTQQPQHQCRRLVVELGGRLVGDQQSRWPDAGRGHREALLLAAGHGGGPGARPGRQLHLGEGRRDVAGHAPQPGHLLDLPTGVQLRKEAVGRPLGDPADLPAAQALQLPAGQARHQASLVPQLAAGGPLPQRQHRQQGGLAAAGRASDGADPAAEHRDVDAAQGLGGPGRRGVQLEQLAAVQHRHTLSRHGRRPPLRSASARWSAPRRALWPQP